MEHHDGGRASDARRAPKRRVRDRLQQPLGGQDHHRLFRQDVQAVERRGAYSRNYLVVTKLLATLSTSLALDSQ